MPTTLPLPGGKLGLSNVVIMFVLFFYGGKDAFFVAVLKSLVALLISGSVTALPYSLVGGVCAVFSMNMARRYIKGIGYAGCGIIGAFSNNIAQTLVGAVIMSNVYVVSYIFVLGPVSVVTGTFTGILSGYVFEKFKNGEILWKKG